MEIAIAASNGIHLPARFPDARDHAFVRELAEAYPAKTEIAHKSASTTALKTAVLGPARIFWGLLRPRDCGCFCHMNLGTRF